MSVDKVGWKEVFIKNTSDTACEQLVCEGVDQDWLEEGSPRAGETSGKQDEEPS